MQTKEHLADKHSIKFGYPDYIKVARKSFITGYDAADQQTAQLKAECERLREALQKIIDCQTTQYVGKVEMKIIARTALNKTEQ